MRLEATIADPKAEQLEALAAELGVSKSQIVEEALALFIRAALEHKRGRKLAIVGERSEPVCEIVSPSLTHLDWTFQRERIEVSPEGAERVGKLVANPPAPGPALRRAMSRKKK